MGAYATNLEFPVGSHLRGSTRRVLKRKMASLLRGAQYAAAVFCDRGNKYLFLLNAALSVPPPLPPPQGSAQPRKTFPTRSRTCGRSAARTSAGRTLSPVQMGRSRATVGECHIPTRLPQPSVRRPSVPVTLTAAAELTSPFEFLLGQTHQDES